MVENPNADVPEQSGAQDPQGRDRIEDDEEPRRDDEQGAEASDDEPQGDVNETGEPEPGEMDPRQLG